MADVDPVADFCAALRQGDLLDLQSMMIDGSETQAPFGVVVISQTCDVVQLDGRPNVLVALAVELDETEGRDAIKGRRPRWVHVPGEPLLFADLEFVASISKQTAATLQRVARIDAPDFEGQRKFALGVGRRFSRLAMPNEVVPWFDGIKAVIGDKANKPASSMGRLLDAVQEFRISAPRWVPPGLDLTLHVILRAGELPLLGSGPPEPADQTLLNWLSVGRRPSEIAEYLFPPQGPQASGADRSKLWWAFGESLRELIQPPAKYSEDANVQQAVASVSVEVVGEDEFTFQQHRRSDEVDLAHLSPPTPTA